MAMEVCLTFFFLTVKLIQEKSPVFEAISLRTPSSPFALVIFNIITYHIMYYCIRNDILCQDFPQKQLPKLTKTERASIDSISALYLKNYFF